MDVTKPGKTAPDATARPVIVGHGSILKQDPMVSSNNENDGPAQPTEEKLVRHSEKVVVPPQEPEVENKPDEVAENPDEPKEELKPTEPTAPASQSDTLPEDTPVSDDSAVVDAVAEQASGKKRKKGELSEAERKKQEAISKLIEEKKYFIPIRVASHKRNARWSAALSIILIVLVGAYLAADANVVNAPFTLPIDLIPN